MNFETVKYFNAEQHEEERYMKALQEYKLENIRVTKSLAFLNLSQSLIVTIGMVVSLIVANTICYNGGMSIGDFIAINTYMI